MRSPMARPLVFAAGGIGFAPIESLIELGAVVTELRTAGIRLDSIHSTHLA